MTRRLRVLELAIDRLPVFFALAAQQRILAIEGLPPDIRVLSGFVDQDRRVLCLTVESEEFDPVNVGDRIPHYTITVHSGTGPALRFSAN